jgi:protoporphyrinogen oxidase
MDIGGHRFFSKSDWVMNWWQEVLPVADDQLADAKAFKLSYQNQTREFSPGGRAPGSADAVMLLRPRLSRIYYRRRFFDYPIQFNAATLANLGLLEAAAIGASYAAACLAQRRPERSLEDFLVNRFGARLYATFFKSYTEKVWGVPCEQISAEWGAQRIKGLSIRRALLHALRRLAPRARDIAQRHVETSLIERFLYPKFGPGQMWEEVAARVVAAGGELHYRHRIVGVRRDGPRITGVEVCDLDSGALRHVACQHFFSTMPLAELVAQLGPEQPELAAAARALPYRDFMTAGLLVRRMRAGRARRGEAPPAAPPDNWIYVQEPDVQLGRLQIFNNWSPHLVRDPDTVWLGLEYFCREGDGLWSRQDGEFLDFAARELEQIGLIDRAEVLDGTVVRVKKAYPAYFGTYRHMDRIRAWLDTFPNLYPIGRNGMHRYNNQDHSMLAARAAVDCVAQHSADKRALWAVNAEEDYHEEAAPPPGGAGGGRTAA